MPDTNNEKAKGKSKISALKLKRETLRELAAGELQRAQGGAPRTLFCEATDNCTLKCTRGRCATRRC